MRSFVLKGLLTSTVVLMAAAGSAAAQNPNPANPAPAVPAPAPAITISGVGYAQYQYLFRDTVGHGNNFDVTRAYVNVVGKFAHGVGARVTTDIYHNGDGQMGVRLKYAYASWTPDNSHIGFRFGLTQTPWLDWEEALWDYRMQGPMALDRNGYIVSSDYGIAVDGSWQKEMVNFQGGFYNGEGYSKPLGDKRKDASARLSVRVMPTNDMSKVGGLRLTGYGQIGSPSTGGTRNRFMGMLSYRDKMLTLAGEFALLRDRDSVTVNTVKGQVISAFGVAKIPNSAVAIIGRVDIVDPNTDVDNNRRTEFIAGVSYQVSPNLRLLGDIDNTSYQGSVYPNYAAYANHTKGLFQIQFNF